MTLKDKKISENSKKTVNFSLVKREKMPGKYDIQVCSARAELSFSTFLCDYSLFKTTA